MYLREDQIDALRNQAFLLTKKGKKRVAMSSIIREAIDLWLKKHQSTEMNRILSSPKLLEDMASAKKELRSGKLLSRKEALGQ
jgi:predicted nucleic acid-binding protein